MYNECIDQIKISKLKSHIIALLKQGKTPTDEKHVRPIALICHTNKQLERMIRN